MYDSLEVSLLQQGFTASSVDMYIRKSKANFNRSKLENQTWSCFSGYSLSVLTSNINDISLKCSENFMRGFLQDNQPLAKLYLKK